MGVESGSAFLLKVGGDGVADVKALNALSTLAAALAMAGLIIAN